MTGVGRFEGSHVTAFSWVQRICSIVSAALVAGLAVLHAYWALLRAWGTSPGRNGAVNATPSLPLNSQVVTWGLVAFLMSAAAFELARTGLLRLSVPRWLTSAGCAFVLFFAFVMLGAATNRFGHPGSWHRVYAPMALVLLASTLLVALPVRKAPSTHSR